MIKQATIRGPDPVRPTLAQYKTRTKPAGRIAASALPHA